METEAYAARIITFAPDGSVVDAARGTFAPQSLRVDQPQRATPVDLADVPVSRVYLGVEPATGADGRSTSLARVDAGTAGATRSFIVIERENGYKQVIDAGNAAASRLADGSAPAVAAAPAGATTPAGAAVDVERGAPELRVETDLGADPSVDALQFDLQPPGYDGLDAKQSTTRYANELVENARTPERSASPAIDATSAAASAVSTLIVQTAGETGARDVARVQAQLDAKRAERSAMQTETAARTAEGTATSQPARDPALAAAEPAAAELAKPDGIGKGGDPPPLQAAEPERRPDVTPAPPVRPAAPVAPEAERVGREVVGQRSAFDRQADARLDRLQVNYQEFGVEEKLASERGHAHAASTEPMPYVRDGQPANMQPGYQQSGRIVEVTPSAVVQDIGQHKVAVYGREDLLGRANDPAQLASLLSRAAETGSSVELNFSRSGSLQAADLSQQQGRPFDQDRGMGRS